MGYYLCFFLITFLVVDLFLASGRHGGSHSFICKNEAIGRLGRNSGDGEDG